MTPDPLTPAKMSVQEKVAELERRIQALEQRPRTITTTTVTSVRGRFHSMDLEPEWAKLWSAFDSLMAKVGLR